MEEGKVVRRVASLNVAEESKVIIVTFYRRSTPLTSTLHVRTLANLQMCIKMSVKFNKQSVYRCDIQNHTKEGGSWIVIAGHVYDVDNFDCENAGTVELVRKFRGCDATAALSVEPHAAFLSRITEKCVGLYADQIYSHKCIVSFTKSVYIYFDIK